MGWDEIMLGVAGIVVMISLFSKLGFVRTHIYESFMAEGSANLKA